MIVQARGDACVTRGRFFGVHMSNGPSRSFARAAWLPVLAAIVLSASPAHAQRFRNNANRELAKGSETVREAFRPVVQDAGKSTVIVLCDGKEAALGTVVGADGWIVTKASELKGEITCRTRRDAPALSAKIVGI